jgi:hypothetical protein
VRPRVAARSLESTAGAPARWIARSGTDDRSGCVREGFEWSSSVPGFVSRKHLRLVGVREGDGRDVHLGAVNWVLEPRRLVVLVDQRADIHA